MYSFFNNTQLNAIAFGANRIPLFIYKGLLINFQFQKLNVHRQSQGG